MNSKVAYVLAQPQTRPHTCHWPGCNTQVPPARWGCRPHWLRLPKRIRDRIWAAYRPGQEVDFDPSEEYLAAVEEAERWILAQEARPRQKALL